MIDLLLLPILTGSIMALAVGPLGSLMVWRKLSFFGDTIAHSTLLGITLGLILETNPIVAMVCSSIIISLVLLNFQKARFIQTDTLLALLAHSSLAIGLVCISFLPNKALLINQFLFGDFLTITQSEAITISALVFFAFGLCFFYWKSFLALSVDEELARIEGLPVEKLKYLLTILTAIFIAITMKVVGILLITALLIIPSATACRLSRSPEAMAIIASSIALLTINLGIAVSFYFDTPVGPSIITTAFTVFVLVSINKKGA